MLIKGFSIFISCGHFDEGMGTILEISVEGHPKYISVKLYGMEQLAYQQMSFKDFFYFSSCGHFVQQSRTILAILVKGHRRNIPVKLF